MPIFICYLGTEFLIVYHSCPAKMSNLFVPSLFFFFLLLCPLAFSQLPQSQVSTMTTLSQKISNPALSWNITREPQPCKWSRVACNPDNSSITGLFLYGLSLSSSDILPTICNIESLQKLDLSNNQLGSIPDGFVRACGGLGQIKLLNFSRNQLVGSLPVFLGFPQLEFLDLSYNSLSGSIGLQLDGLISLRSLNLSANMFNGTIPISLGKSKALEELDLSLNIFNGEIPQELADYQNLTMIDLSGNRLRGNLSDRLGVLQKLEILVLSSNYLTGEIPTALASIPKLSRFSANQNNFTGTIPSGMTRSLKMLDLRYNSLSGTIPPDLLSQSNLVHVDLSFNRLEGAIPENMSENMLRLRLGSNLLTGTIPSAKLPMLGQLTYLELENNGLTGSIPPALGSCKRLALLNLAQNKLSGVLPPQLGNLTHLQVLKLQFNRLDGNIPDEIGNLASLSQLNISFNMLTGPIPLTISNLRNLTIMNLQQNNLSGTIPPSLGNLGSLLELQLGVNRLIGPIPVMPSNLQIALNLSHNLLEGSIPSTLSSLMNLEVLDLSNNNLSGQVPDFLTQMISLTHIILSNNQLSGVLPNFKPQIEVDYRGNNLDKAAPPTSGPAARKKRNSVALAIVIALAFAVLAAILVAIVVFALSRRFYRVNDEHLETIGEHDLPLPQVMQGNLLTANRAHRSSIDFNKAMEEVSNPSKVILKTRFSTYYKATMPCGTCYYIKKLNWSDKVFQLGTHDRFGDELERLGKLNNSNVMTPLAYVLTVDSAYLFYEYAQKGTLYDVLHAVPCELDWASRYSIAVGVAQGLAFLHDCSSGPVLLLDLSTRSILLRSLKEPQVGDIELCKVIDPTKSTGSLSTVAGSVGFIPPEYAYTMRITPAGNVYSFGVVLLELLTGKPAVSEGTELAKWVLAKSSQQEKWDRILDYRVSRTSVAVQSQMLAVLKVALTCVSVSPEARPKMRSVLRMLLNAR